MCWEKREKKMDFFANRNNFGKVEFVFSMIWRQRRGKKFWRRKKTAELRRGFILTNEDVTDTLSHAVMWESEREEEVRRRESVVSLWRHRTSDGESANPAHSSDKEERQCFLK